MPSFDIVSEIDKQEIDNALNQARKELATRFDFKGITAEILAEKDKIILSADDAARLRGLREIVIGKLSKRGVDLRNIEHEEPAISSVGHARQELTGDLYSRKQSKRRSVLLLTSDSCLLDSFHLHRRHFVISSEVENGATGRAATWTGRPKAERTGSERIKSLDLAL